MPGKVKATLLGALVGALVAVVVEVMAMVINDEAFFGSERSWIILVIAIVVFSWSQLRAYDQKIGLYKDDTTEKKSHDS